MGKLNIFFLLHYIWGKKREGRKNGKKMREKYKNGVDMLSDSVVEKVAVPPSPVIKCKRYQNANKPRMTTYRTES